MTVQSIVCAHFDAIKCSLEWLHREHIMKQYKECSSFRKEHDELLGEEWVQRSTTMVGRDLHKD